MAPLLPVCATAVPEATAKRSTKKRDEANRSTIHDPVLESFSGRDFRCSTTDVPANAFTAAKMSAARSTRSCKTPASNATQLEPHPAQSRRGANRVTVAHQPIDVQISAMTISLTHSRTVWLAL